MSDLAAYQFNLALRRLTTPEACRALFSAAIAPHGFDTFACGEVDQRYRDRAVFYLIDWPEAWRRFYMASGLLERDPVVDALAYRTEPFTWSDLRSDRKLAKVGREALDLIAREGWSEGLVVPLQMEGARIGLTSLAGHRIVRDPELIAYLVLISICLHGHIRTLVARAGMAVPPVGLTEREIACVQRVARGLSDRAIAEELGIAVSTAHEFVEKAKRRLHVRSRPELIAIAVSLGIITA